LLTEYLSQSRKVAKTAKAYLNKMSNNLGVLASLREVCFYNITQDIIPASLKTPATGLYFLLAASVTKKEQRKCAALCNLRWVFWVDR
jgi:hypothetical protein